MRKETWGKIYCTGIDSNSEMKSPFLTEIAWEILAAMSGNIKVIDQLVWLRLNDGPGAWENNNISKKSLLTVTEMLQGSQHINELENFIKILKKIFEEHSTNLYDSEKLIRKCLFMFSELEKNNKLQKPNLKNKFIKTKDKIRIKRRILTNRSFFKLQIKDSNQLLQHNLNKAKKLLIQNEIKFNELDLEAMSHQLQTR
jgi:hypothetical protein